jgi:elongation factor P
MLAYNEVTLRKIIIHDDEPHEVLASHVFRKQQRKPVNATKLRNLLTGRVVEHSFAVSDKVDEADMKKSPIKFVFEQKGQYVFHYEGKPAERFNLDQALLDGKEKFLKAGETYQALIFTNDEDEERIIGVALPVKIEVKVTEAAPAVKGNTANNALKTVIVETGANINVPMFINEGDIVTINTETGEYVGRAEKS